MLCFAVSMLIVEILKHEILSRWQGEHFFTQTPKEKLFQRLRIRTFKGKSVIPYMQTKHWLPSLHPPLFSSILTCLLSHLMYNFSSCKRSWDTAGVISSTRKDELVRFPCLSYLGNFQVEFFQAYSSCPLAALYFWWGEEAPWELPSPERLLVGAGLVFSPKAKWPSPVNRHYGRSQFRWMGVNATNFLPISAMPLQIITPLTLPPQSAAVGVSYGKQCCLLLKAGILFSVILFNVAFGGPSMWFLSLLITALGDYSVVLATERERGRGRNGMVERERFLR